MAGHNFKQLVFEQFFPDSVPLPEPEPTATTSPVPPALASNTEQPEDEVKAPEPDPAEKEDVQVTTIPLPGEVTPAAADVAPPESDFPELESPGSELEDYEQETGYESCTQGQSSSDNDNRLSTIPEEPSESEGSHDNFLPVDPREEDHTDVQLTDLRGEPPQMVLEGPTTPEMSTDFSPAQLHPESFPPLYFNPDRTTVSGTPGGIAPSSAGEGQSVKPESHGPAVPEFAQEDPANDNSEDNGLGDGERQNIDAWARGEAELTTRVEPDNEAGSSDIPELCNVLRPPRLLNSSDDNSSDTSEVAEGQSQHESLDAFQRRLQDESRGLPEPPMGTMASMFDYAPFSETASNAPAFQDTPPNDLPGDRIAEPTDAASSSDGTLFDAETTPLATPLHNGNGVIPTLTSSFDKGTFFENLSRVFKKGRKRAEKLRERITLLETGTGGAVSTSIDEQKNKDHVQHMAEKRSRHNSIMIKLLKEGYNVPIPWDALEEPQNEEEDISSSAGPLMKQAQAGVSPPQNISEAGKEESLESGRALDKLLDEKLGEAKNAQKKVAKGETKTDGPQVNPIEHQKPKVAKEPDNPEKPEVLKARGDQAPEYNSLAEERRKAEQEDADRKPAEQTQTVKGEEEKTAKNDGDVKPKTLEERQKSEQEEEDRKLAQQIAKTQQEEAAKASEDAKRREAEEADDLAKSTEAEKDKALGERIKAAEAEMLKEIGHARAKVAEAERLTKTEKNKVKTANSEMSIARIDAEALEEKKCKAAQEGKAKDAEALEDRRRKALELAEKAALAEKEASEKVKVYQEAEDKAREELRLLELVRQDAVKAEKAKAAELGNWNVAVNEKAAAAERRRIVREAEEATSAKTTVEKTPKTFTPGGKLTSIATSRGDASRTRDNHKFVPFLKTSKVAEARSEAAKDADRKHAAAGAEKRQALEAAGAEKRKEIKKGNQQPGVVKASEASVPKAPEKIIKPPEADISKPSEANAPKPADPAISKSPEASIPTPLTEAEKQRNFYEAIRRRREWEAKREEAKKKDEETRREWLEEIKKQMHANAKPASTQQAKVEEAWPSLPSQSQQVKPEALGAAPPSVKLPQIIKIAPPKEKSQSSAKANPQQKPQSPTRKPQQAWSQPKPDGKDRGKTQTPVQVKSQEKTQEQAQASAAENTQGQSQKNMKGPAPTTHPVPAEEKPQDPPQQKSQAPVKKQPQSQAQKKSQQPPQRKDQAPVQEKPQVPAEKSQSPARKTPQHSSQQKNQGPAQQKLQAPAQVEKPEPSAWKKRINDLNAKISEESAQRKSQPPRPSTVFREKKNELQKEKSADQAQAKVPTDKKPQLKPQSSKTKQDVGPEATPVTKMDDKKVEETPYVPPQHEEMFDAKAQEDKLKAEKVEAERLEHEKAEQERVARGKAERAEREKAEREKAESERIAAEEARKKAEQEKAEREKAERERVEREKAREKLEQERIAREKAELEKAERERIAAEEGRKKAEQEKAEHGRVEREKAELEKAEQEKAERERADRERAKLEKAEQERISREKAEHEKAERDKAEQERIAREQAECKQAEQERVAREKAEREKSEREKIQQDRLATEKAEREKSQRERLDRARIEKERLAHERAEHKKAEREKAEHEEAKRQVFERELGNRQRLARETAEREEAERERLMHEKFKAEEFERHNLAAQRIAREMAEYERVKERGPEDKYVEAEKPKPVLQSGTTNPVVKEKEERTRAGQPIFNLDGSEPKHKDKMLQICLNLKAKRLELIESAEEYGEVAKRQNEKMEELVHLRDRNLMIREQELQKIKIIDDQLEKEVRAIRRVIAEERRKMEAKERMLDAVQAEVKAEKPLDWVPFIVSSAQPNLNREQGHERGRERERRSAVGLSSQIPGVHENHGEEDPPEGHPAWGRVPEQDQYPSVDAPSWNSSPFNESENSAPEQEQSGGLRNPLLEPPRSPRVPQIAVIHPTEDYNASQVSRLPAEFQSTIPGQTHPQNFGNQPPETGFAGVFCEHCHWVFEKLRCSCTRGSLSRARPLLCQWCGWEHGFLYCPTHHLSFWDHTSVPVQPPAELTRVSHQTSPYQSGYQGQTYVRQPQWNAPPPHLNAPQQGSHEFQPQFNPSQGSSMSPREPVWVHNDAVPGQHLQGPYPQPNYHRQLYDPRNPSRSQNEPYPSGSNPPKGPRAERLSRPRRTSSSHSGPNQPGLGPRLLSPNQKKLLDSFKGDGDRGEQVPSQAPVAEGNIVTSSTLPSLQEETKSAGSGRQREHHNSR
ncbi:hypothetical protein NEUTE1DRAFT_53219 [Neurospora tetrasperma FGSC 2508]|uniref:Uncharacterized protein n=1 Tax=Neurospora tetrasperma (strain FGSC 2508 / ATCC MYA-4615 / P0657) TaxID=510951 RepID=F8N4B9_NEUT8|nr:uncharacterized protein NEUTE1DRAFT_53219 [Neurospora tetrasperma FGSC 2508]EGO51862.1 hypothetical protein NEUTE1DRAFT_53219 [Neurospora tetrasperma FGSC 2508]